MAHGDQSEGARKLPWHPLFHTRWQNETSDSAARLRVVQLREDVTRFRYGDEQHLDEALTRIFQFGSQKGIPRRSVGHEAPAPFCDM